VFLTFDSRTNVLVVILLGTAFYLIASGSTLFGLLTCRPAKRLGDISYGIYLLQGLIYATVLLFQPARAMMLRSPLDHWMVVLFCGVILIIVSTISHVTIERPCIDLGKQIASVIRHRRRRAECGI
jgi:peptidoglycan/LPS O-acetylase OafA/YrhL